MSPWKYHGRGTPVLRMSFRGIGQIERATGFQDAAMLGRLKEMCRTLYEAGKDELLRDIREGRITLRLTARGRPAIRHRHARAGSRRRAQRRP